MPTPRPRPLVRRAVAALRAAPYAALCAPGAAAAQRVERPPAAAPSCLDSIPARALTRVGVVAAAELGDSTHPTLVAAADLLTQSVAERARTMLGAAPGQLPAAEPAMTWRDVGGALLVTAYRDGRMTWRVAADTGAAERSAAERSAAALLGRALAALREAGDAPFFLPDDARGDSVAFRITVQSPFVAEGGAVVPLRLRAPAPIATALVPGMSPVTLVRQPRLAYPSGALDGAAIGTVILQFFVDESGRADLATVRDLWPASRPRLTGELKAHYDAFVASARRGLAEGRWQPARIGGCPVRQLVHQPFQFELRR